MQHLSLKQIKQPLADGNNTLDYVNEYVALYELLFSSQEHYQIDDKFYHFRNTLLHGLGGTLFLKELFEISILAYVSRFGFHRLFEASLWLYRAIYSLRVSSDRNVREDSVFRFVYINQFVDNIIEVFTPDELFLFLEKFRYNFNTNYITKGNSKRSHVKSLQNYFGEGLIKDIEIYEKTPLQFDRDLLNAIAKSLNH